MFCHNLIGFGVLLVDALLTRTHGGSRYPNRGGMEEIIAFVCSHCGAGVEVGPPKVH